MFHQLSIIMAACGIGLPLGVALRLPIFGIGILCAGLNSLFGLIF